MSVKQAEKALTERLVQDLQAYGWPSEFSQDINVLSHNLLDELSKEWGEFWIGKINLYGDERKEEHPTVIWKYPEEGIYNFGAAFAIPKFDEKLEQLIIARDKREYTNTTDDGVLVKEIFDRIEELGGKTLHWV